MSSKEKRVAYFDLKGGQHFEADLALLKEKSPDNEWCKKHVFNPDKAAPEILFALLDHATKDEIVANRRKVAKGLIPDPLAEKSAELEALIEKLTVAGTTEDLLSIMQLISVAIGSSTELDEKFGTLAVSAFNESEIRINMAMVEAKEAAEKELLTTDIVTLDVEAMLSLLFKLGITVTSQDPEVLRLALNDAKLQLEKTDEGDGLEKTEIPAELEKVNELEVENEELKDQLDQKDEEISDLESEKEDLQGENESLQEENVQLQEELEAEKKNQQQEPDQQPAANSKKKKNSPKSTGKGSKKPKSSKPR